MKRLGFVSIRSASLAIVSAISYRPRHWRTGRTALSVGAGCLARKTPSRHFSRKFSTPTAVAKKWFARFKPLPRRDQCRCHRHRRRRIARHAANSTRLNWKRSWRIPPKTYNSKAEAAGGKIIAWSWSTARVSAWRIRTPINKTGLNPKARNPAEAFHRHEFAPASACKRVPC